MIILPFCWRDQILFFMHQLIQGPLNHAMVCVDGQQDIPVPYNESINRQKDTSLRIIHPIDNDFDEGCREKLGWSLDITANKT